METLTKNKVDRNRGPSLRARFILEELKRMRPDGTSQARSAEGKKLLKQLEKKR